MVSIKDVSKKAKVSKTAVSFVLNGREGVSENTRRRVLQTIEELNYKPNFMARGLAKGKTNNIALLMPISKRAISDPVLLELIGGLGDCCTACHINLIISNSDPNKIVYKNLVESKIVDGLVLTQPKIKDERIKLLKEKGVPFVVFGTPDDRKEVNFIDTDNSGGVLKAIDYLVSLGHKKIAFISGPSDDVVNRHRLKGFKEAVRKHKLPIFEEFIKEADFTQDGGYQVMKKLLEKPDLPTAVFVCSDLMAIGVMKAIKVKGLVVGKHMSVVGFDNIQLSAYTNPPLTTVEQDMYQAGFKLGEMLIKLINKEKLENSSVILPTKLVIRESCGKPCR